MDNTFLWLFAQNDILKYIQKYLIVFLELNITRHLAFYLAMKMQSSSYTEFLNVFLNV